MHSNDVDCGGGRRVCAYRVSAWSMDRFTRQVQNASVNPARISLETRHMLNEGFLDEVTGGVERDQKGR